MRLAIALGRRHLGLTWPNPSVGAVVVDEARDPPRIVATGMTARGGRPHAEPAALADAGTAARGATLFVSLEPCSHHGRTPPCVDAIKAAGIARVVSGLLDPDPRVAGRGHARLAAAGIAVETGCLAAEAAEAHRGHLARVRLGRPFVTVKLARTADGFAAGLAGEPRLLVTGATAGARTHLMRAHADAVMVGIGTVQADDPRLDVRLPGLEDRSLVRVVLDTGLRLSPASRLAASAGEHPVWVVCGETAAETSEGVLRGAGIEILRVPGAPDGRIDLPAALRALAGRGLTSVFCEGGPILAEALLAADLVDELVLLTSPRALGREGRLALAPASAGRFDRDFALQEREELGEDHLLRYGRVPCSPVS